LALHLRSLTPQQGWSRWLTGYVDVAVGYRALNFKPDREPAAEYPPRRSVCFGVTVDLGGVLDDVFLRTPIESSGGRFAHSAADLIIEHVQPPGTVLSVPVLEDGPGPP